MYEIEIRSKSELCMYNTVHTDQYTHFGLVLLNFSVPQVLDKKKSAFPLLSPPPPRFCISKGAMIECDMARILFIHMYHTIHTYIHNLCTD